MCEKSPDSYISHHGTYAPAAPVEARVVISVVGGPRVAAADYEPGPDESVGAKLLRAQLSAERAEAAVAQAAAVRAAEAAATERVRAQCAEELERALEAARAKAAVAQAKAVRAAEERCAGERVVAVQTAVEEVAHDFAIEPELVAHSRMNTSVASAFEAAAASAAAAVAAAARLRDGEAPPPKEKPTGGKELFFF